MNLGGDDFLTKPAELPEILAAVNARLERRQRQRARQAEQVQTAVKIFSGIVDDLGSPTAALHWLAEAAAGEKPAALPPEPPELPKSPETILAVKDNRRFFVKLSEIKALLADGEYSRAYWGKDQHMMFRKPLKQWERELSAQQFIRIHRNAIINLAFLDFMRQSPAGQRQIHLKDFPEVLEVSQRKAAAVNRALKNFPRR
jgi:DNA-binding LytR/AlgR family response regulator